VIPKCFATVLQSYIYHHLFVMQVCTEWHEIIRRPSLWSVIDLTSFPACCSSSHQCTYLCYASYRHRLKHFLEYLIEIRPVMRTLKFSLDIDDPADGYRSLLSELIRVH